VSALASLIRIHRWQLDERRRDLATLEDLAAQLREERRKLDAEDERERAAAAASPEAAFGYPGYARDLIDRRYKLERTRAEVADQIARARAALADAYQEVKRYEIAAANREKQQEEQEAKRQRRTLDELGVEGFRRKTAGRE
jgi:flagellar export protein FliJ